jgi:hypothetical protein
MYNALDIIWQVLRAGERADDGAYGAWLAVRNLYLWLANKMEKSELPCQIMGE